MTSPRRRLYVAQILRWADDHHRRTELWPIGSSGPVRGAPDGLKWGGVDYYLRTRSAPGQPQSLAQLLQARRGVPNRKGQSKLTITQVLAWADAYHRRTGRWPFAHLNVEVPESPGDSWRKIGHALWAGRRGLRPPQSLTSLLQKHRGVRNRGYPPTLTVAQILRWADAHHARTGAWPGPLSGAVHGAPGETWAGVHNALRNGRRGLRTRITLRRLLAKHRGVHVQTRVQASEADIVRWARAHYRRTGRWPTDNTRGGVHGHPFGWSSVGQLLRRQTDVNGQPKTLSRLLQERLGVCRRRTQPLTLEQVRAWALAHRRRTGRWPRSDDGIIREAPQETWSAVWAAMRYGGRKLPPTPWFGTRGFRNRTSAKPKLTEQQIIAWAKAHRRRTGDWPRDDATPVSELTGRTWRQIHDALRRGHSGMPGGITLARLLASRCGARRRSALPALSLRQILAWADAHHAKSGSWPSVHSGPIPGTAGETWYSVAYALEVAKRGLPRMTLRQLIEAERGVRLRHWGSRLSETQIVEWAKAHHERTGAWPHLNDGEVLEAPDRTWRNIDLALTNGFRGITGGSSLARLLARRVGARNQLDPPRLTIRQILAWADAHYARTGIWPSSSSDRVTDAPGENWPRIHEFLKRGGRGLPGGSSLVALLTKARGARYRRQGLPLSIEQILGWAAAHHEITGQPPTAESGPVRDAPGENWAAIDAALSKGTRNLRGGSSLSQLLRGHYVDPYPEIGGRLTERLILHWARAFKARAGRWPTRKSAYVHGKGGEKWSTIDLALREGHRGLPGGSSLAKLLAEHRHTRIDQRPRR